PLPLLLGAGLVISVATTGAVYVVVRWDLDLPARVGVLAVAYNALVVVAKFGLAPWGLYELSQRTTLESFFPIERVDGAVLTAATILALYAGAYILIYLRARRRVEKDLLRHRTQRLTRRQKTILIAAVILGATGSGVGVALLIPVLAGGSYLGWVFSSAASLAVAVVLAGATALAVGAMGSAADRARVVGDAAVLVSFFWLGLYVLVLYHVLWVVYVLVLTALWPLKVVIPK
ncbi:MAG: hypothetical protein M3N57_11840, partial [Actinomycetota bacterium]|nr:hypothetical protein [Actinomycetota bacterium]